MFELLLFSISSVFISRKNPQAIDNLHYGEFHPHSSYPNHFMPTGQNITRREAIINYMLALYNESGYFHCYLRATPLDPRLNNYPSIIDYNDFYKTFEQIGATGVLDWSNVTRNVAALVNTNPSSIFYKLVNSSLDSGPGAISSAVALELFPKLGIGDLLDYEAIGNYIVSLQRSDGGFLDKKYEIPETCSDMIATYAALHALSLMHRLHEANIDKALAFVLSCYRNDGGFSNTPASESLPDVVPLGLWSLKLLGRSDLIRVEDTTSYLLQYWDDEGGHVNGGTIVNTERFVLSMIELNELDRINMTNLINWVLWCQTHVNGVFLPTPDETDIKTERFEWCRAAVNILSVCNRTDALDEKFFVAEQPVYTVPEWYKEFIREHFGTTPTTIQVGPWVLPRIDIMAVFTRWGAPIAVFTAISAPCAYICHNNRAERKARRELRKKRKRRL